MKVLVTGHQGYLGSVVVPVLQQAGHLVGGLDVGYYADCVLGPTPQDPPSTRIDLRDVGLDEVSGYDAIVHLAALSNDPLGSLAPEITHQINHHASVRLARAAKQARVSRFVYASTCSVYGVSGGDALVNETAPLAPVTAYAESKVRVEDDLHALADDDFHPTSLRNATAFGFSPRLRADIVLNNLVGHALLSGVVLVLSDGTPWRPLVHALDIAETVREVLAAPLERVHDRALNVGDEANNVTVATIAEQVAATVPGARVEITGEAGADPRSYRVDFSSLREALPGWRCQRSVADGAEELARAYRDFGLTQADFEQRFVRLAALRRSQSAGELDHELRRTTDLRC